MVYNPITLILAPILFLSVMFFLVVIQINLVTLAFAEIGIPGDFIFMALLASLLGSFINIPVKKIPRKVMAQESVVNIFGLRYDVPVLKRKVTVIAINVGGAIIPVLLSLYLLLKTNLWAEAILAILIMSMITHRLARPIRGVGIALPAFIPPVFAALVSIIIVPQYAPVVAYVSGTMGTLIGADIFNIKKLGDLGAPIASIGGAGTFDGIFLNGILAVILASIFV